MTTINDTYINALLADATYALEVDEGSIPDGFGGTALVPDQRGQCRLI